MAPRSRILRATVFFAGLFFLLNSCSSASFSARTPRKIPEDFTGIVHAGQSNTAVEYSLLDEMSAVWMLNTFRWNSVEREQGKWDFSWYDAHVDSGKKAGKKILAVLAYDAAWLHKDGQTHKYISPEDIPLFLNFVEQTVRRYRGKVDAWEIWNEPNWVFWKGSKKEFFALSKATAQKIREIDPDTPILAGAFARVPVSFVRGMFESGAMEHATAMAFHPYAVNPQASARLYDRMKKAVDRYDFSGDIWITEVGYPTHGWYPWRVSEKQFPAYVVKALTSLAAKGARAVVWYQLFDLKPREQVTSKFNSEDFFGLMYPDYTKKAGADAYSLCAKYLAGTTYQPEFPERIGVAKSVSAFYFHKAPDSRNSGARGSNTLVIWNNNKNTVKIQVSFSGSGGILHSPVSGEGQPIFDKP